jgi:hypothetical protein
MPSNPKRTIYPVAAAGGAPTIIPITVNGAHYVEIAECPPKANAFNGANYAPQGLNYTLPDDGFLTPRGLVAGDILPFGNSDAMARQWGGRGLGFAARADNAQPGNTIPATTLCEVISATANATQVEVREWL